MYNMYSTGGHQTAPPPPYQQQPAGYASQPPIGMMSAQQTPRYQPQAPQNNLYAQVTTRAGRQRASTLEQHNTGIPAALQRVMGHLDPNAPIRLQPSPAYYPPPPDGAPDTRRRASRAGQGGQAGRGSGNRDFIRNLEDRTLEEGFMNSNHWQ
jgi:dual specificity protein kinase YAK1